MPTDTDTSRPERFEDVPSQVDFPAQEKAVLAWWRERGTYRQSVEQRPADNSFAFFDGPPFATGLPHYGHLLASIS